MAVMPKEKDDFNEKTKSWRDIDPESVKKDILTKYPPKVARKRSKHFVINKKKDEHAYAEIQANVRTIPGIISQRGCCYAGCKGVVMGPTRDIINLTHGPIGCGFYSWLTRRNQTDPSTTPDGHNFMTYCFSTDMQEREIVFGGEKKLKQAIQEAYDIFKPKMISVFSTCPVGLIGDDVHSVTREMQEKLGITIFGFSCEGYKGVSQSAGHHVANNGLFKHVIGQDDTVREGAYKVNLLGEYNIGGDEFLINDLFKKCGITIISTFSGNSSVGSFQELPYRRSEPDHVSSVHQLCGGYDGAKIRHPLDENQFSGRPGHIRIAAENCPLLRRPKIDRSGGSGYRRRNDPRGKGSDPGPATPGREIGHDVCGRIKGPPLPGAV